MRPAPPRIRGSVLAQCGWPNRAEEMSTRMNEVKRRELFQSLAAAGTTLILPACGDDSSRDETIGAVQHTVTSHPRAYVTTHTVNPGARSNGRPPMARALAQHAFAS